MRIVLLANTAESMVWFRQPLMRRLSAAGHQVWVMAPEGPGIKTILACGCSFIPLDLPRAMNAPSQDLAAVRAMGRMLRLLRADVVLSYTPKGALIGALAAKRAGVKAHAMLTGLGYASEGGDVKAEIRRRLFFGTLKLAASLSESVIVLNTDNRRELLETGTVGDDKLMLLPGEGVDLDKFAPVPPAFEEGQAHFVVVARLVAQKGVREFVSAAKQVLETYPACRFTIAGSEEYGKHPDAITKAELDDWKANTPIRFLGHIPDIRVALGAADCFVLPSWKEGLPMSTMEALAMGKPVITTTAPGCVDTVEDGHNGFLVGVNEPEALADRMLRIAADPALAQTLGQNSRQLAEQRFAHTRINDQLLSHLGVPG